MIQLVLPKEFWHFNCATLQPSAACNSSQTAWLQLGLFYSEDGKMHTTNPKNWGMTVTQRKHCWTFLGLDKTVFFPCSQK